MTGNSESKITKHTPALSRADLLPIAGLILLALVLYHPMFTGRPVMPDTWERFEPWNSELGYDGPLDPRITNSNNDAILLYIPWNKFAHDEFRAGRIPAWDPYCLCGVPLASNHLVPVFYPIYTLIVWLFSPLFIMGISGLVHTLIMAIFFYLFLKEWLGNHPTCPTRPALPTRTAGWIAASFLIVSMLPNPHYQPWPMTMAWFPAIWFFYERWLKHRSPMAGLWMALCWAGPLLAGYPSLFFQLSLFTAVWFLVRPNMMPIEERPKWITRIGIFIWPFLLAVGLSAVQNVPTMMASIESDRTVFKTSEELAREAAFTIPSNQQWQTHVKRLLQPALPIRFQGNDFFNRGYVGFIPVVFALFGLGRVRRKDFPRVVLWLALIIGPFALIPALNFGVYWLTRGILIDPNPPVEVFGFLVLMLMAVGVKNWSSLREEHKSGDSAIGFWLSIGAIVLFVYAGMVIEGLSIRGPSIFFSGLVSLIVIAQVRFINRKPLYVFLLVLLLLVPFFQSMRIANDILAPKPASNEYTGRPMPETEMITALKELTDPDLGGGWGRVIRYSEEPVNVMSLTDQPYTFYPNLGTYFGIPDAFGYHNLAPKLRFDFFREIQEEAVIERRGIVAYTDRAILDSRELRKIGVRYILSDSEIDAMEQVLYLSNGSFHVYDLYKDDHSCMAEFLRYWDILLDDEPMPEYPNSDLGHLYKPARFTIDEPGHIVIEVCQLHNTFNIINEGNASGWVATCDGVALEIDPDNPVLTVISPKGRHVIEFRYIMPGLLTGWIITSLAMIFWLIMAGIITWKNRSSC